MAPNVWVLIGCRVLQAMGGSGLLPSATGIVVNSYPAHQRERLAILGLLRSRFRLDKPPEHEKPIDYPGILLFASSITCVMVALTSLGSSAAALGTPLFWGLLLACLGIGWLFVRQEKRASDPMLDFAIAVRPPFLQVNVYNLVYGMGIFSVMSTVASVWLLKYGYRWPMMTGTSIVVVGLLVLGFLSDGVRLGSLELGPFAMIALSNDAGRVWHGHRRPGVEQRGHRAPSAGRPLRSPGCAR